MPLGELTRLRHSLIIVLVSDPRPSCCRARLLPPVLAPEGFLKNWLGWRFCENGMEPAGRDDDELLAEGPLPDSGC